jgi:hypothetical protein
MAPSKKRGICVPWNFSPAHFALYQPAIDAGNISWLSNWELWKPQGLPAGIPFVPLCRTGDKAVELNGYFTTYASDDQVQGVVLGFNEPDIPSQANMGADAAAELWRAHVLPLKARFPGLRLGSPAVSNAPQGRAWLDEWFAKLGGVASSGVDFVAVHYYSPDVKHFAEYVEGMHRRYGRRVWVTEFCCTNWNPAAPPSEAQALRFMTEAVRFLEAADFVERYAWFGAMEDVGEAVGRVNGLQDGGRLSEAGKLYTSL